LVLANLVHTTDGREGGNEMSSLLGGVKPMKNVNGVLLAVLTLLCFHEASSADKNAKPQHAQAESDEHYYFHDTEKANPHAAEWGYSGKIGPSHWGRLSPEYVLATDGKRQSRIDIRNTQFKPLPKLDFQYRPSRVHLVYNGRTIQENEDPGSFGVGRVKLEINLRS
jgi:carbonic anhydrase